MNKIRLHPNAQQVMAGLQNLSSLSIQELSVLCRQTDVRCPLGIAILAEYYRRGIY